MADKELVDSAVEFANESLGEDEPFDKSSFFREVLAAAVGLKVGATPGKTVGLASAMWKIASGCPFAKVPALALAIVSDVAKDRRSPLEALRKGVAATPGMQRKLAGRSTFLAMFVANGATGKAPPPPTTTTPGAPVAPPSARFGAFFLKHAYRRARCAALTLAVHLTMVKLRFFFFFCS